MARASVLFVVLLLALPLGAGCLERLGLVDPVKNWDVQLKLTVIVSAKAPAEAEDVPLAVELATRTFNATGAGATYRIINDAIPDGPATGIARLAKGKPVAFIAALGPDEVQPALVAATTAKIPLILVTPTNGTPAAASGGYLLRAGDDPAAQGRALAALAPTGKVVLVAAADPLTTPAVTAFRSAVGDRVVKQIDVTGDAAPLAKQACDAKADVVALFLSPREAGALVGALEPAGCRSTVRIVAAPWTRQSELIDAAGRRSDQKSYAEGVEGITPGGTEPGVFRGAFEGVYGRAPGRLAAPAHDAVAYATLAAFAAKGGPDAKPFHGALAAADIKPKLAEVAFSPGIKEKDFATGATAAKGGDDVDWVGFAQDFDAPGTGGTYDVWRINAQGGFETTGETVPGSG